MIRRPPATVARDTPAARVLREDVAAHGWQGMEAHARRVAADAGLPLDDVLAVARELYADAGVS